MAVMQQMLLADSPSVPVAFSFQGITTMASGTTFILPGVAIGTPSADRVVCCPVSWLNAAGASPSLLSATIGGVPAPVLLTNSGGSGTVFVGAAIILAPLSSGTTATITLNFSAAILGNVSAYAATGITSLTPVGTKSVNFSALAGLTYADTIAAQSSGGLLCAATLISSVVSYTATGMTADAQGAIATIGGAQDFYFAGSGPTTANAAFPFSITHVGGAGSGFTGPIITASFR